MATTKIRISFGRVHCLRDSSVWGEAEWVYHATVGGAPVGDPTVKYLIKPGGKSDLSTGGWSAEVDVSKKKPGDAVEASFSVEEQGVLSNSDMGQVKLKFHHPFDAELDYDFYGSPAGIAFKTQNFIVEIKLEIIESTPGGGLGGGVPAGKKGAGATLTTVSGSQLLPRVEISPVVPVLKVDQRPPRPDMYGLVAHGKDTSAAKPVPLKGTLDLNALPNPSLIPIISPGAMDFKKRAARLAVTFLRPHDLKPERLAWVVKSGPVQLHGKTSGVTEVLAYGTGESDTPAEIELRWNDETGPVLSTFRAWVGHVKKIPIRAMLVIGSTPGATPRATPADIARHIRLANVLLYQSGLIMVPDHDHSTWDGATESADHPGVYVINTADNSLTLGVSKDLPPHPMRLNFRPGAMHLCYIKSLSKPGAAGSATDRPGLKGDHVSVDGTPSASWRPPSGVKPDKDAEPVKMLTMAASDARSSQQDKDYRKARQKLDPKFPDDAYSRLWGCIMPDYIAPDDEDWPQTVAHEVGHVLGLRHRGNGATDKKPGSDDEVNGTGGKGHPFLENVMCYGYARSQDLDLVQTTVIRAHPSVISAPPKPAPPPPPPKPVDDKLKELQLILGVPQTGVWDDATEAAAKKNTVRYWSKGPVVEWVQKQLHAQGIDCGPIDGLDADLTTAGIRKWQKATPPLYVDGVAGPKTMKSLAEA